MGSLRKMTAIDATAPFSENAHENLSEFNAVPRRASIDLPSSGLILKSFYYDDSAGFTRLFD